MTKQNLRENAMYSLNRIFKGVCSTLTVSSLLLLGGCSSSSAPDTTTIKSGYVIDSAIKGISYKTATKEGTTDINGTFFYSSNDPTITFKLGHITLADFNLSNIDTNGIVLPTDMANVDKNDTSNEKVVKILRFLQSLDSDNNTSNGIDINSSISSQLTQTINILDANVTITNLKTILADINKTMISEFQARTHFENTLNNKFSLDIDTVAPEKATLTTDINQTTAATTNIELNGEVGARIFINGVDINQTIGTNGKVNISLDTNATIGNYNTYTITLRDDKNNISQSLDLNITKQSSGDNTPTIDTIFSNFSLLEDSNTTSYDINISDIDGDNLTLTVESNDTSILTVTQNWATPVLQADYTNQTLDFNLTTVQDAFGTVKITIKVIDTTDRNSSLSFDVNVPEKNCS